jgi:biotin-(acetyl-CoA carboxylase) ligase
MSYVFIPSPEKLELTVNAQNELGKICNQLHPELIQYFEQFKGKKIIKVTPRRALVEKVNKGLEEILDKFRNHNVQIYVDAQYKYSLHVNVKLCYSINERAVDYINKDLYVAHLNDTHMVDKQRETIHHKDDYDASVILSQFQDLKELQARVELLENEVRLFQRN